MATFKCKICGEIFEAENAQTAVCPLCKATGDNLEEIVTAQAPEPEAQAAPAPETPEAAPAAPADLAYDPVFVRRDPEARFMAEIHEMAVSGKTPLRGHRQYPKAPALYAAPLCQRWRSTRTCGS